MRTAHITHPSSSGKISQLSGHFVDAEVQDILKARAITPALNSLDRRKRVKYAPIPVSIPTLHHVWGLPLHPVPCLVRRPDPEGLTLFVGSAVTTESSISGLSCDLTVL